MKKNTFFAVLFLFFYCYDFSFSQNIFIPELKGSDASVSTVDENVSIPKQPETKHSKEALEIMNEMIRLKREQHTSNGERISELQRKLENIEQISITKTSNDCDVIFSKNSDKISNQIQTDAVTLSSIYTTYNSFIKAIATQVEQRAPNIGTIWAAFAVGRFDSGVSATPDTIILYRSTNNGLSYNLYSRLALASGNKVSNDEMDMEIIESSTSKYIYLAAGYSTNGYTGLYRSSLIIYDIVNNTYSSPSLNFPGMTISSKYYRPRITSDNAYYSSNAYVTVSIIQDSTDGLNHFYMTKFCRIFNPYTITPAITYNPAALYLPLIYAPFSSTVHADIAYYNNGGSDTIIFVLSGYPGATDKIFLLKGNSNTSEYPYLSNSLSGTINEKQFARIASTGGFDQKKMLMVFNESNGSINTYETTDAVNWIKKSILGGIPGDFQIKKPDIIGQRNIPGKFYITSKLDTPLMDFISSYNYNDLVRINFVINHNNIPGKSYASPKPSFRFNNSDSCLTLWSTASSMYSSSGCSSINTNTYFIIQGLYDALTNSSKSDIISRYLRNSTAPFALVDSSKAYNNSICSFLNATTGTYYISMKGRNFLETWYYQPVTLGTTGSTFFGMTSTLTSAFGSNMIQVNNSPVTYAFYSGDVNQDGSINLTDVLSINNDANTFVSGYVVTDLTGNEIVDITDVLMAYNNSVNFVSVIRP